MKRKKTTLRQRFWKVFYRVTLGADENARRTESAKLFGNYLAQQVDKVGIGRNYDVHGNQIRGWHRRSYQPAAVANTHPLIEKYSR